MKWKTKNGQILKPSEMETSHILNCINMLNKFLSTKPERMEYGGESEHALDAVEQENRHNEIIKEEVMSCVKSFKRELKIRSL